MSADAWTAVGTLILAAMTLAAVLTTIIITMTDSRRADARVTAERKLATEQEQEAEAWAVEVIPKLPYEGEHTRYLGADVTNLGSFTITRVEAQFSPDGKSLIGPSQTQRLWEHDAGVRGGVRANFTQSGYQGILTRGTRSPLAESLRAPWRAAPGLHRGSSGVR